MVNLRNAWFNIGNKNQFKDYESLQQSFRNQNKDISQVYQKTSATLASTWVFFFVLLQQKVIFNIGGMNK